MGELEHLYFGSVQSGGRVHSLMRESGGGGNAWHRADAGRHVGHLPDRQILEDALWYQGGGLLREPIAASAPVACLRECTTSYTSSWWRSAGPPGSPGTTASWGSPGLPWGHIRLGAGGACTVPASRSPELFQPYQCVRCLRGRPVVQPTPCGTSGSTTRLARLARSGQRAPAESRDP